MNTPQNKTEPEHLIRKRAEEIRLLDRLKAAPAYRLLHGRKWRKLWNYASAMLAMRTGRTWLANTPYHLCVDPGTACQLDCPFCFDVSGYRHSQEFLDFADYEKLLKTLGPNLLRMDLSKGSEPLLHPRILDMISLANSYGIETTISSNLNHLPGGAQELVKSGLDLLIVSADGVCQESYAKYRVGGKLEVALNNMRAIVRAKRELGSPTPCVCWQFLVFKHNQHELARAAEMAAEIGADQIMFHPPVLPDDKKAEWQTDLPEFSACDYCHSRSKSCNWPWGSLNIRPDGSISLCYSDFSPSGHIRDISGFLKHAWNGPYFRKARALAHLGQSRLKPDFTAKHPCARCHAMGDINFSI